LVLRASTLGRACSVIDASPERGGGSLRDSSHGAGLQGDGNPIVLVNGEAVATWTFSLKGGAKVQPFEKLGAKTKTRLDEKLGEIAALLSS
jgi:hypothetical protein